MGGEFARIEDAAWERRLRRIPLSLWQGPARLDDRLVFHVQHDQPLSAAAVAEVAQGRELQPDVGRVAARPDRTIICRAAYLAQALEAAVRLAEDRVRGGPAAAS